MLEALIVTLLPAAFLAVLFAGGALLRRRQIDMDGEPPIGRAAFYGSKYSIMLVWAAMVLTSWGAPLAFGGKPGPLKWLALCLWILGFTLLFIGRFGLGDSFRIGRPRESTGLRVGGLFSVSRNPMYAGMYMTLLAAVLYTLNPLLLLIAVFIVAVHHRIVLAEEEHLRNAFGEEYRSYCCRVRRYL